MVSQYHYRGAVCWQRVVELDAEHTTADRLQTQRRLRLAQGQSLRTTRTSDMSPDCVFPMTAAERASVVHYSSLRGATDSAAPPNSRVSELPTPPCQSTPMR